VTRRAGGWILGLLIVGAMGGGGWFAIRRALQREEALVVLLVSPSDRGPTRKAIEKGARFALEEAGHRAGKYRLLLQEREPGVIYTMPVAVAASIGPGEAILARGHPEGRPFSVSVFDTHPAEPQDWYPITPGWAVQGASAARWAKKAGASRVLLLIDPSSFRSKAIAAAFHKAAPELGLTVTELADVVVENVERLLAAKPDLIFFSGEEAPYGTTTKIFTAFREKGFAGKMVAGEADPEVSFLATRPTLLDGTYLVSPFAPAPQELAARMGFVPGPHVTAGYFAMQAVLDTIDRANSIEEGALHRAAATLNSARRPCALYVARNGVFEFVETLP
jgi:hypothetical protein